MTLVERLARRLRILREQRGWSQRELAQRSGVHFTFIARIETSRVEATVGTLAKLATALRVRPSRLLE